MQIIGGFDERVLIERLKLGDSTAFELLFNFYYPGLVIFASHFGIAQTDSEEIVQDFFVHLWQHRLQLKSIDSLKSYFFTSIKNRAFNHLKKQKVNNNLIYKLQQKSQTDTTFNPDIFVASELQDKIRNTVKLIPPKTKEVFFLSRLTGLTNDEIAVRLKISKRTVETHISNALKIFRTELREFMSK